MERRPFAFCCATAGGHVEACDCVNKDHGFALFSTKAAPVVANPETSTEEYAKAKVEMLSLLNSIWNVEYRNTAPCRGPLDDLSGMVSQLESMYVRVRNERDALRADIAALQARSAEPAGEEPVGYTGSGSLDGIKHGLEGSIWGTPEASHPIPLYARPATPTKTERLVEAEGIETVDEDWLTDVINDSIDMDWTGRVGAKAIMRELAKLQEQRIEAKVCHVCGAKGREDHAGHCSESW